MKFFTNKKTNFIFCFLYILFSSNNAYAYLDPGTGSIILQALIAAIALVSSYLGFYWRKVKDFFKKLSKKKSDKN